MSLEYPTIRKAHEAMWAGAPPHPEIEKWMAMRWLDAMQTFPVETLDAAEKILAAAPKDEDGWIIFDNVGFAEPADIVVTFLDPSEPGVAQIVVA